MRDRYGNLIYIHKEAYLGIRKGMLIDVCLHWNKGTAHPVYRYTIVLPNGYFARGERRHLRMA